MKCILTELAKNEHETMKDKRYAEMFVNCPLFNGKQICFWCCLHIRDIAEPLMRADYIIKHPEYGNIVPKETGRDWDDVWNTCSKCSHSG